VVPGNIKLAFSFKLREEVCALTLLPCLLSFFLSSIFLLSTFLLSIFVLSLFFWSIFVLSIFLLSIFFLSIFVSSRFLCFQGHITRVSSLSGARARARALSLSHEPTLESFVVGKVEKKTTWSDWL
jgi:hypothetical protein